MQLSLTLKGSSIWFRNSKGSFYTLHRSDLVLFVNKVFLDPQELKILKPFTYFHSAEI